jgi:hypothetical protein
MGVGCGRLRAGQVRLAGVHAGEGAHHRGVVRVLVLPLRLLAAGLAVGLHAAAAPLHILLVGPLNEEVDELHEDD